MPIYKSPALRFSATPLLLLALDWWTTELCEFSNYYLHFISILRKYYYGHGCMAVPEQITSHLAFFFPLSIPAVPYYSADVSTNTDTPTQLGTTPRPRLESPGLRQRTLAAHQNTSRRLDVAIRSRLQRVGMMAVAHQSER
jgi:hypothetical protein